MNRWKIKEVSFNSLQELNTYIADNNIAPNSVLKYETIFEQLKQSIRYILTYWTINE